MIELLDTLQKFFCGVVFSGTPQIAGFVAGFPVKRLPSKQTHIHQPYSNR